MSCPAIGSELGQLCGGAYFEPALLARVGLWPKLPYASRMKKPELAELVQVADAIERDLARLEELSFSLAKQRLNNEKGIQRAGRALQDALEQQEQLAGGLRELGEAMMNMQKRQQAAIERVAERAHEIQAQVTRLTEHMTRFGALGGKASEATRILESMPPPYGVSQDADPSENPVDKLVHVEGLLASVAAEAKLLASSAAEADLSDIERESIALRQRVDSARAQLSLLAQARPPQSN